MKMRIKGILSVLSVLLICFLVTGMVSATNDATEGNQLTGTVPERRASDGYLFLDEESIARAMTVADTQLKKTLADVPMNQFPRKTDENTGKWETVPITESVPWTHGDLAGCLWYMYELTKGEYWKENAIARTKALEPLKNHSSSLAAAQIMENTFMNAFRLLGEDYYRDVALKGAESTATRYNSTIRAYDAADWNKAWDCVVNVDSLMCMESMFWAAQNGGDPNYVEMSLNHLLKAEEMLMRDDGSAYQLSSLDAKTGELEYRGSHQGYTLETVWARGQAWLVYGFTTAYYYTKDERMLETAKKSADYYIKNVPEDYVPYWDYLLPSISDENKDTSAAAVTASAMLDLSTLCKEKELKIKYWNAGIKILSSLCSEKYLSIDSKSMGIILHSIDNGAKKRGMDVSLIYTDYYFMEALAHYANYEKKGQTQATTTPKPETAVATGEKATTTTAGSAQENPKTGDVTLYAFGVTALLGLASTAGLLRKRK